MFYKKNNKSMSSSKQTTTTTEPSKEELSKEELRMNLKSRIQASSIRRMNKRGKEIKLNELQNQIKETLGDKVDMNKLDAFLQQMNVSKK